MVEVTWEIRLVFLFEGALLVWFSSPFIGNRMTRAREAAAGAALALLYAAAKCCIKSNVWLNMPGMVLIAVGYLMLRRMPAGNALWLACAFAASIDLGRVLVYGTTLVLGMFSLYAVHHWAMRIAANLFKLTGVWLCRRYFKQYGHERIQRIDYAMILLPFAYIYFMRLGFLEDRLITDDAHFRLIAFFFMCGSTLLALWTVFLHVSSESNLRKAEHLQQAMKDAYLISRRKAEMDAQIMRMYHDIKHQLTAVVDAESGDMQKRCAGRLLEQAERYEAIPYTGNAVLDSLLSSKKQAADSKGIALQLMMQRMDYGFMDELDLCALLGNALDNAIEAAEKNREDRSIRVKSAVIRDVWVLKVENRFEQEPVREGGRIVSSKADRAMHGIGLQSIQYCAQKYGGRMEITTAEHIFTLRIAVPLSSAQF